jgi:hypothetical protein
MTENHSAQENSQETGEQPVKTPVGIEEKKPEKPDDKQFFEVYELGTVTGPSEDCPAGPDCSSSN